MSESHELVVTWTSPDRPGLVHAVTGACAQVGGNLTECQQFTSTDTGNFFIRLQVESASSRADLESAVSELAGKCNATVHVDELGRPVRTLILASKASHCLSHLLFNRDAGRLPIDVVQVMANHPDLADLTAFHKVPFRWQKVDRESKTSFEQEVLRTVGDLDVELVVLARYMQILSPELCEQLSGRCINIHHSFLPGFKGANPYRQAHSRGVKLIGATAHFVTVDLDEGPIIEQDVARADHTDTVEDLTARGRDTESQVLARAVKWHSERRVLMNGHKTVVFK